MTDKAIEWTVGLCVVMLLIAFLGWDIMDMDSNFDYRADQWWENKSAEACTWANMKQHNLCYDSCYDDETVSAEPNCYRRCIQSGYDAYQVLKERGYSEVCECVENKTIEHAEFTKKLCKGCFPDRQLDTFIFVDKKNFTFPCPILNQNVSMELEGHITKIETGDNIGGDAYEFRFIGTSCDNIPIDEVRVWNETSCIREECTLKKVKEI